MVTEGLVAAIANDNRRAVSWVNGAGHRLALGALMFIVLAHWAEHLTQAVQIWGLGRPPPQARGVLGQYFPWLVASETLHYGYAILMLIGLFALRNGFAGSARTWWTVALVIQFWHHIEHLLLLIQAQTHHYLFGAAVPTSILQQIYPRVELHLFYNTIVFVPMVIAMYVHLRPKDVELESVACTCARRPATV
jgi:hypothetical protein